MLFPSFNLHLNPKAIAIFAGILGAAGTFLMLGYLMGLQPKEVVCKDYILELQTSSTQISDIEKELSNSKEVHTLNCVSREQAICVERLKALTDNYKKLRCKICAAGAR